MPDGTEFVLDKEKDTESQSARPTNENGEIIRQEYLDLINRKKTLNPVEIANSSERDADTTASEHKRTLLS